MYYYNIWVGSPKLHAHSALTYGSPVKLAIGEVVSVPLRQRQAIGFVEQATTTSLENSKLKSVLESSGVILPLCSRKLHSWMQAYYPAPSGVITSLFVPSDLPKALPTKETPEHTPSTDGLPDLTIDQSRALKEIEKLPEGTLLLHGATGSGKTRVYIELAKQSFKQSKSVIILTPEIGLTPQLTRVFEQVFTAEQVVVLHSNLTPAKRRDAWYRIVSSSKPLIIIGPRSALFAPLQNIGLIVVDEAHDPAYKQEQAPYYQAGRVGAHLARLHHAICVFGTATPSITDYSLLKQKQMPIVTMEQLATGTLVAPEVVIANLQDKEERTQSPIISRSLIKAIRQHVDTGQQALLFLNRRGSARVILCQDCGWQAACPRCDIALIYHDDQSRLRCHTCGFSQAIVTCCPNCQGSEILYHTPGTKSLEQEAVRLFPELKVQRFDSDNLAEEKLERHFEKLVSGGVDIIIGTQLVTKGLDLPNLGVVGIINADTSLNLPDFTAEERTFQQLSQVIGRVGRHHQPSSVVIQTYNPSSTLLHQVISKDWQVFFEQQIAARQQFGFPPFTHLLQLKVARASRTAAQSASQKLMRELLEPRQQITVRGPSPQLHEKVRGKYHWQVIVSSKQRQELLDIIKDLPSGWQYNIDPANLL